MTIFLQIFIPHGIACVPWSYHVYDVSSISIALVFHLKDEPCDDIIIVHVFLHCMDGQVGYAHKKCAIRPCSAPPHSLSIFPSHLLYHVYK